MPAYIDTHSHMFSRKFDNDRADAFKRAAEAGVELMLLPNIDVESIPAIQSCMREFAEQCKGMMGLHPCSVGEDWETQLSIIEKELSDGSYLAVGEIGIDYYWDKTHAEVQREAFRRQLKWAKQLKLPVAIHIRNSFEDAVSLVEEEQDGNLTGVFHCFTGTAEEGQRMIDSGLYLGLGGVLTFKNSGVDASIKNLPLDRMLLETDSPYLAPHPNRGKRNESSFLPFVAEKMASVYEKSMEDIALITSQNAKRLFNL